MAGLLLYMFLLIGKVYISGLVFSVSKKFTAVLTTSVLTQDEHEVAKKTVGKLYSCRPIHSVF